ncbi:PiggyBac transposable element-derived protein 4 [Elysia marginata]|uniref:PiggyBac transposable element-derived protein 4 n=1 Tax=Elysia marginata TaxID=1093978 RepID=A0AAV4IT06_9GAST|nr:PiggyBac transposable element-derived protein 4 [Elysia marginata]
MSESNDDANIEWTADDEHKGDDYEVNSSDGSSKGEEFPDLLNLSDPEQEVDEVEEEEEDSESVLGNSVSLPAEVLSKKGDIIWSRVPVPQVGRTPTKNVFRPPKSNVRYPSRIDSIVSAFKMIFTATIINDIVKMTNLEGKRNEGENWKGVDVIEMGA